MAKCASAYIQGVRTEGCWLWMAAAVSHSCSARGGEPIFTGQWSLVSGHWSVVSGQRLSCWCPRLNLGPNCSSARTRKTEYSITFHEALQVPESMGYLLPIILSSRRQRAPRSPELVPSLFRPKLLPWLLTFNLYIKAQRPVISLMP